MIAAFVAASVTVKAQCGEPGTFTFQPKLGGIISWLTNMPNLSIPEMGNLKLDKTVIGGGLIGGEVEYMVTDKFSAAIGVNYSMAGSGWENTKTTYKGESIEIKDTKLSLGYLNIPVVANFYLFKGFAVKAGVQVGFLTNADIECELKGDHTSVKVDEDFMDECSKVDFSIPVGLSYEFDNHIVLDARYNIGLTKVNKESEPGYKDLKNQVLQFTVGYKFNL